MTLWRSLMRVKTEQWLTFIYFCLSGLTIITTLVMKEMEQKWKNSTRWTCWWQIGSLNINNIYKDISVSTHICKQWSMKFSGFNSFVLQWIKATDTWRGWKFSWPSILVSASHRSFFSSSGQRISDVPLS